MSDVGDPVRTRVRKEQLTEFFVDVDRLFPS